MFPYEMIISGREDYKARLQEAERKYRHMHKSYADNPTLWERTTFRLGDLLITAGEQLKHQRQAPVEQTKLSAPRSR